MLGKTITPVIAGIPRHLLNLISYLFSYWVFIRWAEIEAILWQIQKRPNHSDFEIPRSYPGGVNFIDCEL
jgi:hypothetical protein